jgi:hypothetical protein
LKEKIKNIDFVKKFNEMMITDRMELDKIQVQKTSYSLLCCLQMGVIEAMGKQEMTITMK